MTDEAKKLLLEIVLKGVLARLAVSIPFFSYPVIGQIVAYFVSKVLVLAFDELDDYFSMKHIEVVVQDQVDKYTQALKEVKAITETTTQEEIHAIEKRFVDAARNLIRFK